VKKTTHYTPTFHSFFDEEMVAWNSFNAGADDFIAWIKSDEASFKTLREVAYLFEWKDEATPASLNITLYGCDAIHTKGRDSINRVTYSRGLGGLARCVFNIVVSTNKEDPETVFNKLKMGNVLASIAIEMKEVYYHSSTVGVMY